MPLLLGENISRHEASFLYRKHQFLWLSVVPQLVLDDIHYLESRDNAR